MKNSGILDSSVLFPDDLDRRVQILSLIYNRKFTDKAVFSSMHQTKSLWSIIDRINLMQLHVKTSDVFNIAMFLS